MKKIFAGFPDWVFEMNEVSAGVYEVIGRNSIGRTVCVKGIDLDSLIEQCQTEVRKLSAQTVVEKK